MRLLFALVSTALAFGAVRSTQLPKEDVLAMTSDKCTAIIVGKDATKDGSTMTTHTADCAECDWRINKVAAADWPEGSMRPIYLITGAYPRQVRDDRGETWSPENLEDLPPRKEWEKMRGEILGYIPQVPHTYALIEGMYGIMNEHQVAIGESTCAAKLYAAPVGSNGGKALLEASELSQIALERTKTAREAIQLMGDLAMQYGYYSADWSTEKYGPAHAMGEGGEGLTVIDPDEAWVFHILPDDTGSSAVWVAQRVPDNHIAVIANSFIIRDIDPTSDDFMISPNLYDVAIRLGWYNPHLGKPLDFLKTFAPSRYHPNYSYNRVWRVMSLASPSSQLPPFTNIWGDDYPFSVAVDSPLTPQDLMRYQRDHFEGTIFDTTQGLAAGPYGDPNRYDPGAWGDMTVWDTLEGEFPRTISLFRTSYSFVAQARRHVPDVLSLLWFCEYAPDMSTYIPIYVASTHISKPWIRGTMHQYSSDSAWWNFCVVGNYVARFYHFAVKSVRELQISLDEVFMSTVASTEVAVMAMLEKKHSHQEEIVELLTNFSVAAGDVTSQKYKELFPTLLTTYRDGYVMKNLDQPTIAFDRMFYPKWWLDQVGYWNIGPNRDGILFAPTPTTTTVSWSSYMSGITMTAFVCATVFSAVGFLYAKKVYGVRAGGYMRVGEDNL